MRRKPLHVEVESLADPGEKVGLIHTVVVVDNHERFHSLIPLPTPYRPYPSPTSTSSPNPQTPPKPWLLSRVHEVSLLPIPHPHPPLSPLSSSRYARPFCSKLLTTNPHVLETPSLSLADRLTQVISRFFCHLYVGVRSVLLGLILLTVGCYRAHV